MMNTCLCAKSELSIFDNQPIQNAIIKGSLEEVYPLNPVSDNAPIEFSFTSSDSDMFDLNDTLLEVRGKILYSDNTKLEQTDQTVKPIDLFLHSLFSDVSIYLNEYKVEGGHFLYPYRAYMIYLLQQSKNYKKCQLQAAGYNPTHDEIAESKEFQYIGPLSSELFMQGRYLLNQCTVRVKLNRHKPNILFGKFCRCASRQSRLCSENLVQLYFIFVDVKLTPVSC